MGTVYFAKDVSLNRYVALKVLHDELARDPAVVRSFLREAQVAAPLKHPNIVRVFSAGTEAGHSYIVMEYVPGEPLDRFLRRKGRISWESALHIGGQAAAALHCAHQAGVVHRDVKPANMILDQRGRIHLTDFGIAQLSGADPGEAVPSEFVGTPHFMSPEQCAGYELTPATDLYSLGVTLFLTIAGRLPFESTSPVELVKTITTVEPPRLNKILSEIPDDVARLVAHLLQKRPEDRPKDARTVAVTIEWLQRVKGDQSAWPAALSAFVRDQGDVNTLRHAKHAAVSADTPVSEHERGKAMGALCRAFWSGAVAVLGCCSWLAAFSAARYRPPEPVQAELVRSAAFERQDTGAWTVSCPFDGYRFTDVSWVGDAPVVLVRTEGVKGLLTDGALGLIAVNPESRECLNVQEPMGPAFDAGFSRLFPRVCGVHRIPPMPADTPLYEAVLTRAFQNEGEPPPAVTLAQMWCEAEPRHDVLYRAHGGSSPSFGEGSLCIHSVPKPDGVTLCLVMADPAGRGYYLVERDVRASQADVVGPPLTTSDGAILPDSVQYSPDGGLLAYMRGDEAKRELWVVAPGDARPNGLPLAIGPLGPYCAFSPDGKHMALDAEVSPGQPEIRVVSAVTGAFEAILGRGRLGKEPWHPSGRYVTATAPDDTGEPQVWAIGVAEPHRRVQLTRVQGGVLDGCAVSRDGRWAVAVAAKTAKPMLVFVPLDSVSLPVSSDDRPRDGAVEGVAS
jgi:hypothetical protein